MAGNAIPAPNSAKLSFSALENFVLVPLDTRLYVAISLVQWCRLHVITRAPCQGGFVPVKLYADTVNVRAWPGGMGFAKSGGNYAPTVLPAVKAGKEHDCEQVGNAVLGSCSACWGGMGNSSWFGCSCSGRFRVGWLRCSAWSSTCRVGEACFNAYRLLSRPLFLCAERHSFFVHFPSDMSL